MSSDTDKIQKAKNSFLKGDFVKGVVVVITMIAGSYTTIKVTGATNTARIEVIESQQVSDRAVTAALLKEVQKLSTKSEEVSKLLPLIQQIPTLLARIESIDVNGTAKWSPLSDIVPTLVADLRSLQALTTAYAKETDKLNAIVTDNGKSIASINSTVSAKLDSLEKSVNLLLNELIKERRDE